MEIKEVSEFIPRSIDPDALPALEKCGHTIDRFVDFGSNIFIWEATPSDSISNIPASMLLRHFFDLLDSLAVLIKASCPDPAKLQLRGILETYFLLSYLLETDTDLRSKAFVVRDVLEDISIIEKMIKMRDEDSEEGSHKMYRVNDLDFSLEDVLEIKMNLLNTEKFKTVYEEFIRLKAKRKYYPAWYSCFDGPANIKAIATHLKKTTLYDNVYATYSRTVHASDIVGGKLSSGSDGYAEIIQIRRPTDAQQVARFALILSIYTIKLYVEKRVPEKMNVFREWFGTIVNDVNIITGPEPIMKL